MTAVFSLAAVDKAMAIDREREAAGELSWLRAPVAGELPDLQPGELVMVRVIGPGARLRVAVRVVAAPVGVTQ